jgi:hypothetical protein
MGGVVNNNYIIKGANNMDGYAMCYQFLCKKKISTISEEVAALWR